MLTATKVCNTYAKIIFLARDYHFKYPARKVLGTVRTFIDKWTNNVEPFESLKSDSVRKKFHILSRSFLRKLTKAIWLVWNSTFSCSFTHFDAVLDAFDARTKEKPACIEIDE